MPRITLVGYRGTGKSTVAALLAARLGCDWCDADVELERRLGTTISALVRERGEPAFRDAETAVLRDLLASVGGVLATGGGVVLRPDNRDLIRRHGRPVAWLTAPAEVIRGRLAADPSTGDRRPALAGHDPLAEVDAALAAREAFYRAVADEVFDTAVQGPAAVVDALVAWLAARERSGTGREGDA